MLSREEVLKIARLARLELSEEEIARYQRDLGKVLEHMRELSALPVDATIGVVRHVPKDSVAFREDRAMPFGNVAGILANAPDSSEGSFRMPPVMEND